MKIINPSYEILTPITGDELQFIERCARTCYKSENKITDGSAEKLVRSLIKNGHEAMLEHSILSVKFICDRASSHDFVRHRLASFAQESTRYCNYGYDGELTFIKPCFFEAESLEYLLWIGAMENIEKAYLNLIKMGRSAQDASSVLPNSLKTELIITANYREWRHFFKLRAARATGTARPQIEELTYPLLFALNDVIPVVFEDILNDAVQCRYKEGGLK